MHHISRRQLFFLTVAAMLARGMFTVPREAANATGTGAWLVLVFNGVLAGLAVAAIAGVSERFPGLTAAQYTERLLGKVLGKCVTLLIVTTFLIHLILTTREFVEIASIVLLRKTPMEVVTAILLLAATYLAAQRLETIARAAEFLLPMLAVIYVLLLISTARNFDPVNLKPVFRVEGSLLQGVHDNATAFFGFQALWVTMAYVRVYRGAIKYSVAAVLAVTGTYLLVTVATLGTFGVEHVAQLVWPTFDATQAATPVGSIFERHGSFLVITWISVTFLNLAVHLHAAAATAVHWISRPKLNLYLFVLPLALLVGVLSVKLFPDRVVFYESMRAAAGLGWMLLYALPLLLWLVALGRRRRVQERV